MTFAKAMTIRGAGIALASGTLAFLVSERTGDQRQAVVAGALCGIALTVLDVILYPMPREEKP